MTATPAIVVNGVSGRMGRMLVQVIGASPRARLGGAIERPGHGWIGQDLGIMMGGTANGVIVSDDPAQALKGMQAVVDFTTPASSVALASVALLIAIARSSGNRSGLLPELTLDFPDLAILVITPIIAGLASRIAAGVTVMRALKSVM